MPAVLSAAKGSKNFSKIVLSVMPQRLEPKSPNCAILDCTDSVAKENATLPRQIWCGECITTSNRPHRKITGRLPRLPEKESQSLFAISWRSHPASQCLCGKLNRTLPYSAVLALRPCHWERSLLKPIAPWQSP